MRYVLSLVIACCLLLSGCYQARMTTGKDASNTVVEKKWAASYLYGLVPAEIDVADECPHGIASATRKLSFPNMLVGFLTINIYTPQSVTVTCAARGSMSAVIRGPGMPYLLPANGSEAEIQSLLSTAAIQSSISQNSVQIRVTGE